ncbi:MATE family efflux transporter [Pseudoxanthobacter sp. M-2]|uniref:MATE family efflux transporter n=1 Tax=Pseudoxanthobacter sp. M-2 TaxID=3078754 RepID=UPI0038FBF0D8
MSPPPSAFARRLPRLATEARATLMLALPLAATQLAQIAINTTDVVMVGWLGAEALAAVALGSGVNFVPLMFLIGVAVAVSPLVSQARGARSHFLRDARRSVRQGLWAVTLLGLPCCLALWQTEAILLVAGQEPAVSAEAAAYVRALVPGLIPAGWFVVLRSFVSAMERPRSALVVMVAAFFLNVLINWLLIFGNLGFPRLGVVGAGVASSISNVACFLALLGFILIDRRLKRFSILGRLWRPDGPRLWRLLVVGVPIGASLLLELGLFVGATLLMGAYGTTALAAHQIAIQIAAVTFMVPLGVGQAATVRVGLAAGRGDSVGVGDAGLVAVVIGVGFMAAMGLVMIAVPEPLIAAFIGVADPANDPSVAPLHAMAVTFLFYAALFQVADGMQVVGQGILRGLSDTRAPVIFGFIGFWLVGFVAAAGLGRLYGPTGIWIGLVAGLFVVGGLCLARFLRRDRLGLVARATRQEVSAELRTES